MQDLIKVPFPEMRYIADGATPLVPAPQVEQSMVAHYPDLSKYKKYLKPDNHMSGPLWMPVWELPELEALRAKRFAGKVTAAQVGLSDGKCSSWVGPWLWLLGLQHVSCAVGLK